MTPLRLAAVAALAAAAIALSGCTGTSEPTASTDVADPAVAFVPVDEPDAVAGCVQEGDVVLALDAPGVPTEALAFGDGDRAVVLAHQSGQGPCAWEPYGRTLAELGYRVFLPALTALPDDVMGAAVAWLTAEGVEEYALVGASMGGAFVLASAPSLDPAPAVVIALSSPTEYNDVDALANVGSVTAPVLLVAGDADADFAEQSTLLAEARPDTDLVVVASPAHGIALLTSDAEVAALVETALADALG